MRSLMKEEYLLRAYVIGFVVSLLLTATAYLVVRLQVDSMSDAYPVLPLMIGLATLAIAQLAVQVIFFLHLGQEKKPRLNTMSFLFMLMVVSIIAFGSIWIMNNLDYNMMPKDPTEYMEQEENITKSSEHHDH